MKHCQCLVNGVSSEVRSEGRYVLLRAKAGDAVSLRWPLVQRRETLSIIAKEYQVVIRGNEIVDIDSPGERHPIFQKPQYDKGETRWRTVERFVAEGTVQAY